MTQPTKLSVTIEISQCTYDRLLKLVERFEDTPETVICRLLALGSSRQNGHETGATDRVDAAKAQHDEVDSENNVAIERPLHPPSLKHTKVLRAEVDGREVVKANWTNVRQAVVAIALTQSGYDLRQLLTVCPVNAVAHPKNDEGYTYYEHLGVSIQGQDANHAWQAAGSLAMALGVSIKIWFQWRAKRDAEHPGKRGLLTIE